MRRLMFAVALLASGTAAAVDSSDFQLRDTNDLVRACSVPADHPLYANATGFCHGVLTENKPMLRLAAGLGFAVTPDPEDPTVRVCRLRLGAG